MKTMFATLGLIAAFGSGVGRAAADHPILTQSSGAGVMAPEWSRPETGGIFAGDSYLSPRHARIRVTITPRLGTVAGLDLAVRF